MKEPCSLPVDFHLLILADLQNLHIFAKEKPWLGNENKHHCTLALLYLSRTEFKNNLYIK